MCAFASVYRQFRSIEDFIAELNTLKDTSDLLDASTSPLKEHVESQMESQVETVEGKRTFAVNSAAQD